jgi:hypothetical protein
MFIPQSRNVMRGDHDGVFHHLASNPRIETLNVPEPIRVTIERGNGD